MIETARGQLVRVERRASRGMLHNQILSDLPAPVNSPDRTLVAKLDELASRVRRLTVTRDPERFFEERSEIAGELQRLAGAIR